MDFSLLPPEIISGQIYAGPGPAPLIAAARAWSQLAESWEASALEVRGIVTSLSEVWAGGSAAAMRSSAQQYLNWMDATASQARQSAAAAFAATSAVEEARAAVVPVPVVASNRAQLLMLVASNLVGQNTAAIAALEAQYEAMWAQDVAAMSAYQASSLSSTSQLSPFQASPQVSHLTAIPQAAAAAPADAVGDLIADVEAILNGPIYELFLALLGAGFPVDIIQLFSSFFGPFLGSALVAGVAEQIADRPPVTILPSSVPQSGGSVPQSRPSVTASAGTGNRIGPMRVPPSWAQPQQPRLATPLPPEHRDARDRLGLPVIPAVPVLGAGKRATKKRPGYSDPDDMHYGAPSPSVLPRHPSGG